MGVQAAQAGGQPLSPTRPGPAAAPGRFPPHARTGRNTAGAGQPAPFAMLTPRLRHTLAALAALSTCAGTHAAGTPEEPLVVNGCPIWPYTRCAGADLRHADLSGKNLAGADFSGADLSRADLRGANLAGTNFDGANLTAARLNKASAPAASFRKARLVAADFEFARLMRADFSGADLTAANLEMARVNFAWFKGARLVSANLQEAKFVTANLQDAEMEGNVLRYTIFPDTAFEGCRGCPAGW